MKRLAVIIPTHNRKEYLRKLLHQLSLQIKDNFVFTVVVVIDGSDDGTKEMMENEFNGYRYLIGNGNWWFTKSVNEGIKYIESWQPVDILILNDDCEIRQDYLANLYRCKESLHDDCIVGSLIVNIVKPQLITFAGVDKINWWTLKSYINPLQWKELSTSLDAEKIKTLMLCARGTLIPLNILHKLNYLDEISFPQYGSDDDLCYKATENNIDMYIAAKAIVFDHYKLSSKASPKLKPAAIEYTKQLFNRYSSVYLGKYFVLNWRYGFKLLFPLYIFITLIGVWKSYFKYR